MEIDIRKIQQDAFNDGYIQGLKDGMANKNSQKELDIDDITMCIECGWKSPDNCKVCRAERSK
jgi:hypothetical protein